MSYMRKQKRQVKVEYKSMANQKEYFDTYTVYVAENTYVRNFVSERDESEILRF